MGYVDARFALYLAVITLLIVTPGPDMALVTRNALLAGRRAASATALGVGAGSVFWALASVGGIAVLLEKSVVAFTICKLVGAVYLGYLGLKSLVACWQGRQQSATITTSSLEKSLSAWSALRQGLLGNLLNPKAGAIFATILPQFILPGDSTWRLLLMLLAYEIILLTWLHLYGYLISRAGQSRAGKRIRTWIQGITGGVLLALGIRIAFEQKG